VFTGWVDAPGIKALLGMAWAGLAPYREGFHTVGNKLFEYMAGGLPVLLAIGGDAAALLAHHECGLTYRSGSGADLARLLRELVGDPTRRDFMAANSRRAYEREYRAERVYGDMAEFVGSFTP
jgi:glycosyltransferase involved in cell wall biosynthesis